MNLVSNEQLLELIQKEIELMPEYYRQFISGKLIAPTIKKLNWEYGNEEEFDSWLFAEMNERNVGLAYCLGGFGALGSPWGLVFVHSSAFGMDSGWYRTLNELVKDWVE